MKILIFGAHPDDPESSCGGLAIQCVKAGHEVTFLYGTVFRQGKEYWGRPEKEVRTEEALNACKILGVRAVFLDYPHEHMDVNIENITKITDILISENPDIVIAHWAIDTHPDHRSVGTLALSAFLKPGTKFEFYYFEVMTGRQSIHFHPTHYVDISDVAEIKHQSLLCHKSQDGEAVWQDHELMHRFRGRECGVEKAEAYIRVDRGKTAKNNLPSLAF